MSSNIPPSFSMLGTTLEIVLHLALISVLIWITIWGIKKTLRELRATAYEASVIKTKVGYEYHHVIEPEKVKAHV